MPSFAFLTAFFATLLSMTALTRIAVVHHDKRAPASLSELAAAEDRLLARFRKVLFICATLFAITIYWFIVPRLQDGLPTATAWTIIYLGILATAVLPARGKTFRPHVIAGYLFASSMLVLAFIFWRSLQGTSALLELAIVLAMLFAAFLTLVDKKRFIIYELTFIYLNHLSIIVAALALVSLT